MGGMRQMLAEVVIVLAAVWAFTHGLDVALEWFGPVVACAEGGCPIGGIGFHK